MSADQLERDPFTDQVLVQVLARRARVIRHLSPEDKEALVGPARSIVRGLWRDGFNVEDAVRFVLLGDDFSPHLDDDHACDEMAKLKAKYGAK